MRETRETARIQAVKRREREQDDQHASLCVDSSREEREIAESKVSRQRFDNGTRRLTVLRFVAEAGRPLARNIEETYIILSTFKQCTLYTGRQTDRQCVTTTLPADNSCGKWAHTAFYSLSSFCSILFLFLFLFLLFSLTLSISTSNSQPIQQQCKPVFPVHVFSSPFSHYHIAPLSKLFGVCECLLVC